jgi:phosphoserine phosphatase RsbX
MRDDPRLEWGVAARTRLGEVTAGDRAFVTPLDGGTLGAVVDGLGHGPEAARAASIGGRILRQPLDRDLVALAGRCHEALRGTRGAALSLALVSASERALTWLGVGGIEGRVFRSRRPRQALLSVASGVLGHRLPPLRPQRLPLDPGDVIVLATDGVERHFDRALRLCGSAAEIAERVVAASWRGDDDALVLVVRYLGRGR